MRPLALPALLDSYTARSGARAAVRASASEARLACGGCWHAVAHLPGVAFGFGTEAEAAGGEGGMQE